MDRRKFSKLMGAGAAASMALPLSGFRSGPPREGPPNIVYIMADDMGYGHLGCYGQEKIRTPNIDQLCDVGMKFTQAYAGCTVCAPSRSSLMTGRHTGHTSVRANSGGVPLRDEDETMAEVLKQAGYTTGGFGKWGLGEALSSGLPTEQGFDTYFGYYHQIQAHFHYPEYLWKNGQKFPLPGNIVRGGNAAGARVAGRGKRTQYGDDVITAHALNFIESNQDRPFFCYLASTIPHVELDAPKEAVDEYRGVFDEEACQDPRQGYSQHKNPKAVFAAMVTRLDKHVGMVVDKLEELGIDDNTLLIFTSDNGPQPNGFCTNPVFFDANGPLRGFKRDMYEGGIRVPAIAHWPGQVEAGVTNDHPWYFPDVMPTFAELADADVPSDIDGISFLPTLLGDEQERHDHMYWEYDAIKPIKGAELPYGTKLRQAVREGDWKAVRNRDGADLELYNLSEDLDESNDLADEHPDRLEHMQQLIQKAHVDPHPQVEPEKVPGRRYF